MEGSVLGFKIPGFSLLATMLVVAPAAVLLTTQDSRSEPAAEECIAHPTAATPPGQHWYYRVNRAKQHCWYLGKADKHGSAHKVASIGAATAASAPAAVNENGDEAASDAAPSPVAAAIVPAQSAPAPSAAAPALAAPEPSAAVPASVWQAGTVFTTRWPGNLPNAVKANESDPDSASNASGEGRDMAEPARPMPATSPRDEAERARAAPAGATALRYLSIAGILAIPLMLAVGWGAKYARRRPQPLPAADLWREVAKRKHEQPPASEDVADHFEFDRVADIAHDQVAGIADLDHVGDMSDLDQAAHVSSLDHFAEELACAEQLAYKAAPGEPPAPVWRDDADVLATTPPDPVDDLKTSLAVLMRDLRRAGAFEPVGEAERSVREPDGDKHFPILQAAE
jgi:hypothetical protein